MLAVEAVLDHLTEQERGVVVATLGAGAELARPVEQLADGADGVRPVERQLERTHDVRGELVQGVQRWIRQYSVSGPATP